MSAKFNFKRPDRFDAIRAEKGVDHTIIGQNGFNYGTFKTSLFDDNTKIYRLALERYFREYGKNPEASSDTAGVYLFVMMFLHDWSGVLDADGNEVPFSKEAAYAYFSENALEDAWLYNELLTRSRDVDNYQAVGDPRASKKAAAGN